MWITFVLFTQHGFFNNRIKDRLTVKKIIKNIKIHAALPQPLFIIDMFKT